jgi:hypothetical protein
MSYLIVIEELANYIVKLQKKIRQYKKEISDKRYYGFSNSTNTNTTNTISVIPETTKIIDFDCDKYKKMSKVGVPDAAVRSKMKIDGKNDDYIINCLGKSIDDTSNNPENVRKPTMIKDRVLSKISNITNQIKMDLNQLKEQTRKLRSPNILEKTDETKYLEELQNNKQNSILFGINCNKIIKKLKDDNINMTNLDAVKNWLIAHKGDKDVMETISNNKQCNYAEAYKYQTGGSSDIYYKKYIKYKSKYLELSNKLKN